MVSGIKNVNANPTNIKPENVKIIALKLSAPKPKKQTYEIIAPSFPDAADIPWQVDRYLVGNTSPGMINVVAFGPKLLKKLAKV